MDHILVQKIDRTFTYLSRKDKLCNYICYNIFSILNYVIGIQYPKSQIVREFDKYNLWVTPGIMRIFSIDYIGCIKGQL